LIKVANKRRFKIFIIVSVIVLIVLIWGIIWVNIEASKHIVKQGNLPTDNNANNSIEHQETNKEEDVGNKGENEEKPQDQGAQEEQKNPSTEPANNGEDTGDTATKPVVVPEDLPEEEIFSVYNKTLIIGDSRTEGFKLYSGVKNASYFCMKAMTIDKIVQGKQVRIDGQTVSVYDLLNAASYDKVIVCVGLNELGWNHIETFLDDYGQLIDRIKEKQPNATIYMQAVLPVSKSKNDSDKVHNNAQVYWYNENIIKLASGKGVEFVNPAAALVDNDGYLVTEATTDGVHLNAQYCKIWAQYLAELIK